VRYDSSTTDHIPANLELIFGAKGWACTSTSAATDITSYGYLTTPFCGFTS
jgi:hypothetical protein